MNIAELQGERLKKEKKYCLKKCPQVPHLFYIFQCNNEGIMDVIAIVIIEHALWLLWAGTPPRVTLCLAPIDPGTGSGYLRL